MRGDLFSERHSALGYHRAMDAMVDFQALGALARGLAAGGLPAAAFASLWALDAASICCFALLCWRLGVGMPAWNQACKESLGASWLSVALSSSSGKSMDGNAHPGRLCMAIGMSLSMAMVGLAAFVHGLGGQEGLEWARFWGALAELAGVRACYVLAMGVGPLILVRGALRDAASPTGKALQAKLGDPLARERAAKERSGMLAATEGAAERLSKPAPRL